MLDHILALPAQHPPVQPDRAGIEARGAVALAAERAIAADLWWLAMLRLHDGLHLATLLLLPPLAAVISVEVATGGLPAVLGFEVAAIQVLFALGFGSHWVLGLCLAQNRGAYLINLWKLLDLLSAIPLTYAMHALRIGQVAQLGASVHVLQLSKARNYNLPVRRLAKALGIAMSAAAAGAIAIEGIEPNLVADFFEAMWWSITTVSTVGYGDITPKTHAGRMVGIGLMVTGVGVFSYLAGIVASVLVDAEGEPTEDPALTRIEAQLEAQSAQIRALTEALKAKNDPPTAG